MKKLKYLVPIFALTFMSCDNYLDINNSENIITYSEVTPEKQIPGAMLSAYRVQATTANQLGNVFMNSWTRNVRSFGNGFDKELQLNIDNGFYTGIWEGIYLSVKNFEDIINYPNADHSYDNYIAASKICKVYYMQKVVDLYGDAPYSQAFKGNSNLTPAYDDDFVIYQRFIEELEEARALISAGDPNAKLMANKDIMFGGDMVKWNNFANFVQLKLCLRMAKATGAAAAFRDAKLADLAGVSYPATTGATGGVPINPGFSTATEANMNPLASTFFYTSGGANQTNRTFITVTGHFWKSLRTSAQTYDYDNPSFISNASNQIVPSSPVAYANIADPRFTSLSSAGISQPARRAVTQGRSRVTIGASIADYDQIPARLGATGILRAYTTGTTIPALSVTSGYVVTSNEILFTLAEVALRAEDGQAGFAATGITGSTALFNAAVTDSFAYSGTAGAAAYLSNTTGINSKPNFGIVASTTFNEKLHAIMFQKWIALAGINGIESYIDYTRTGYPLTPVSTNAISPTKPLRLIYPISEYIANSNNVPSLTNADIFNLNAKSPFWLQ